MKPTKFVQFKPYKGELYTFLRGIVIEKKLNNQIWKYQINDIPTDHNRRLMELRTNIQDDADNDEFGTYTNADALAETLCFQ